MSYVTPWEAQPLTAIGLPRLGPKSAEKLARADIVHVGDLLALLPRTYLDYSAVTAIEKLRLDQPLHIRGRILSLRTGRTAKQKIGFLELLIDDGTGTLRAVFFNQSYLRKRLQKGQTLSLFGKVRFDRAGHTMTNPQFTEAEASGEIQPVYRQIQGLRSNQIAAWVNALLPHVEEPTLPANASAWAQLPSRRAALTAVHRPADPQNLPNRRLPEHPAIQRLILDEFFVFQQRLHHWVRRIHQRDHPQIQVPPHSLRQFTAALPFSLTDDQRQCVETLATQLQSQQRIHHLIQGDVGCGKTVVGLAMARVFGDAGWQSALLCPTSVLAQQHVRTAQQLLGDQLPVFGLRSDMPTAEQQAVLAKLAAGEPLLVIGTHRLFQADVAYAKLGLVMVDEQHRFGVNQRRAMLKKGTAPHYLAFSATPIPRSLALTLYGELDLLQIRQKPAGRQPVTTRIKRRDNHRDVLAFIKTRLRMGEGAYWVVPAIDDQDDLPNVAATLAGFQKNSLRDFRIGQIHGRMDKDALVQTMDRFRRGLLDLVVATTVVEVGVDIPHATVMVVDGAEHFGLSQLHQLRGRIGRADKPGACFFLVAGPPSAAVKRRMQFLENHHDGFAIAEFDLGERGAGQLLGMRQSGDADFRIGDPWLHRDIMASARQVTRVKVQEA